MVIILLAAILLVLVLGAEGFVEAVAGLLWLGFWLLVVGVVIGVWLWYA
jgi:hypothetical protein